MPAIPTVLKFRAHPSRVWVRSLSWWRRLLIRAALGTVAEVELELERVD